MGPLRTDHRSESIPKRLGGRRLLASQRIDTHAQPAFDKPKVRCTIGIRPRSHLIPNATMRFDSPSRRARSTCTVFVKSRTESSSKKKVRADGHWPHEERILDMYLEPSRPQALEISGNHSLHRSTSCQIAGGELRWRHHYVCRSGEIILQQCQ